MFLSQTDYIGKDVLSILETGTRGYNTFAHIRPIDGKFELEDFKAKMKFPLDGSQHIGEWREENWEEINKSGRTVHESVESAIELFSCRRNGIKVST